MIHVSNEFKELMETRTNFRQYAIITTDEWTLRLDESQFTASNNYIVDGSGISGLPLGVAIQKNIQIEIINNNEQYSGYDFTGAEIHLFLDFPLSSTTERISKGVYTVLSPATYGDTIIITAVDKMHKADVQYKHMINYPATAAAVVQDICQICGFIKGNISFANDSFVIQTPPEGTCRQILGQIAMLACGNARINNEGRLDIIPYSYDGFDSEDYHTLRNFTNLKIEASDVTVTGVKMVIRGETADEDRTVMVGSEGYAITVENSLVEGQENVLLTWLYDSLSGLRIRPFSGDMVSNPLVEFMDLAKIVDRRGYEYSTIITDVNFQVLGFTTVKNTFPSTLTLTTTYPSEATRVEQIARKLVEYERKSRSDAIDQLNKDLATSSGLYQTDVEQPDGSVISYFHDKPSLEESKNVLKITSEAIGISNDGGETYHGGFTFDAETVMKFIQTEGLEADWVKVGNKTITTVIDESVSDLQNQIDGNIESHYYDYAPTLNNIPASSWTTEDEKLRHEGDLFFDKTTGYKYRFFKNGDTWQWTLIKDTDITTALESINEVETELSTFEGEISAKVTSVETTAQGAATTAAEAKVAVGNITLVVTGADGKKTSIQISDGAINLTGEVLAQRIAVATLMAKDLTATGKFQVDNGVWSLAQTDTGFRLGSSKNKFQQPYSILTVDKDSAGLLLTNENGLSASLMMSNSPTHYMSFGDDLNFYAIDDVGLNLVGITRINGTPLSDLFDEKIGYKGKLTSSDDLNNVMDRGFYYYDTGDVPANAPFANAAIVVVFNTGATTTQTIQMVFRYGAAGYGSFRGRATAGWQAWAAFATTVATYLGKFSTESALETALTTQINKMSDNETATIAFQPTFITDHVFWGTLYRAQAGWFVRASSLQGNVGGFIFKAALSGSWLPLEWENPPMSPSMEYRTTERLNSKPVYRKRILYTNADTIGTAGTYTSFSVAHGISNFSEFVRCDAKVGTYPLPYISTAGNLCAVTGITTANINLRTNSSWTSRTWYFDLYYTKTS